MDQLKGRLIKHTWTKDVQTKINATMQKNNQNLNKEKKVRNEVKRLMIEHKVSQKVAQSAWDALCDGNYLANCDPLYDVDDDVDPWDGQHEELRKRVEAEAIEEAKADAIQEAKNERTFNFF